MLSCFSVACSTTHVWCSPSVLEQTVDSATYIPSTHIHGMTWCKIQVELRRTPTSDPDSQALLKVLSRACLAMAKRKFEDVCISLIRLGSPKVSVQGG